MRSPQAIRGGRLGGPSLPAVEEPQVERSEQQNDADVCGQPLPEPMLEEENVHRHHDGHQREGVQGADGWFADDSHLPGARTERISLPEARVTTPAA
jgi:hypothetical protein